MVPPITISASIEQSRLRATVENASPGPLRIWSRKCSWGYSAYSILVARAAQAGDAQELTARPVRWTVNPPRLVEIEPGERAIVEFAPGDPAWAEIDSLEPWKDEPWEVRIRLVNPDTAEAREHQVFIGEAVSPVTISDPPHDWLFDREARND